MAFTFAAFAYLIALIAVAFCIFFAIYTVSDRFPSFRLIHYNFLGNSKVGKLLYLKFAEADCSFANLRMFSIFLLFIDFFSIFSFVKVNWVAKKMNRLLSCVQKSCFGFPILSENPHYINKCVPFGVIIPYLVVVTTPILIYDLN